MALPVLSEQISCSILPVRRVLMAHLTASRKISRFFAFPNQGITISFRDVKGITRRRTDCNCPSGAVNETTWQWHPQSVSSGRSIENQNSKINNYEIQLPTLITIQWP